MKKLGLLSLFLFVFLLTGCELLEGIEDIDDINDLIDDIDEYIPLEDIDDAFKLATGGEIEGTFTSTEPLTYYFYLPLDIEVVLNVDADFDSAVVIRDYETKDVVIEVDDTDFGDDVYTLIALDEGEYEIEISGYTGDTEGVFSLSLQLENQITPLEVGVPASGDLSELADGFYAITIEEAGMYQFTVDAEFELMGIFTSLDGLYEIDPTDDLNGLEVAFEVGTYYLKVMPYDLETVGEYELLFEAVEDTPVVPTEETLSIGSCIMDTVFEGEENVYTLDVTDPSVLNIYAYSTYDTDIYILDELGAEVASDYDVGDFNITFLELEPGIYELHVLAYTNPFSDPFDLCVEVSENLPYNQENLTLNTQVDGTLEAGMTNRYTFTIETEGLFTTYLQSGLDTIGILYDAAGNIVRRDDGFDSVTLTETPDFKIENTVLEPGTYELYVLGYDASQVGEYVLTNYFRPYAGIDHEILPGQTVEWLIVEDGEIPYFFYLTEGGYVTLSLDSDFDSIGRLYDANDTFIYSDDELIAVNDDPVMGVGTDYVIEGVYLEPGFYRISTEGAMPGQYGDFALTLEVVYGDMESATHIYKESQTEATLTQGVNDWYEVELFNPGTLSAYLDSEFDSVGYLMDEYGRIIHQDDESLGLDFYLSWYLEPGVYYFVVTGFTPLEHGNYKIITDFVQYDE